ncbi:CobW family GTP-binding protein [Halobaculum lipolyticum]|uniref:CobW family GTP-binding protein n=1 Tax=Halobaculum lipolyticum TaxID=3032001 RepID=A0ABD5W5E9_9EURY|nr:GTP-binding protein [Halobaculum sp. DT31]
MDTDDRIPITLLCGPLGAGKTTLVNRLVADPGDRRLAVVLNDMGEVNVDAATVERETDDGVIDLSNGCICCRLGDDLVGELLELVERRDVDHVVIEASGISEPLPIARTLTTPGDSGDPTARFRLAAVVAVVDAYGFWKAFDPEAGLPASAPDPDRPLAEVLVDQIEFCDSLLLNKCDLVPDDALDAVEAAVRELQPRAPIRRTVECDVPTETVLGDDSFDFDAVSRAPGWKRALAAGRDGAETGSGRPGGDDHGHGHDHDHGDVPAAVAHGVGSIVYEHDRPFHPERFAAWLDEWDGRVVRAKGFAYVASRPDTVFGLSQAGPSLRIGPLGEWGDDDPETRLVFIGRDLDDGAIERGLDACIVADADLGSLPEPADDPFPIERRLDRD